MWHLSNAGVILKLDDLCLGIDLFTAPDILPYQALPLAIKRQLADSEYSLRFLFATHLHKDHFNLKDIQEYLVLHPQCTPFIPSLFHQNNHIINHTTFLHTPKAADNSWTVSSFQNAYLLKNHKFSIYFLPTKHMGSCANLCIHYSILIIWDRHTIFINGDARPSIQLYQDLKSYTDHLDILISPFPCMGLRSARKNLSSIFLPRQIFLVHIPDPKEDIDHWTASAKQLCIRSKDSLPDPIFCENLGNSYYLEL